MSTEFICPQCKKTVDQPVLNGCCPACLLLVGVGSTMDHESGNTAQTLEQPGMQIGRYKLLEQIGEGGFGIVYMAEQQEPVRRRVALKVIKPGMDSKQVIARFEAERQALAMMDHENIARVLDAGTSETGRPYFVMELVRGLPITQYCDQNKLNPRQRLELMVDVCRAIQHAHQKGIIHRDIKPSNVLVTLYDGRPVTKVIDFGVAKAIQQPLTEKTMFTRFGQVMGTLEYMSPEQAEMSGLDIDTRGDIYSLGVLMYELLTGSTPLSREKLRSAAFDEVLKIIRTEEPLVPSLRLDKSGKEKQTISSLRGLAPEKLETVLKGELDWIVMKALEKDRSRRYENANEFANDIQRFLKNEPIEAAPPSSLYRFKKFVFKHRAAVMSSSAILAALLIGLFASLFNYVKAVQSREAANQFAAELQVERGRLVESLAQTKREEAAKSTALKEKAVALEQRTTALVRSDTLRLAAESLLVNDEDPGLALRLAADALELDPQSFQASSSFLNAIRSCHEIKTLTFDDEIRLCAFAKYAELAFLAFEDRIEAWDVRQGKAISRFRLPAYLNIQKMVPNPNGTRLAVLISGWKSYAGQGGEFFVTDRAIRVFDVKSQQEVQVLRGHTDRVVGAVYSDDGSKLLTASWDGTARIWDADDGQQLAVANYVEQQSSKKEQAQERIQKHLDNNKFAHISLADAEFNRDGTISLFPLNGRKISVMMFEQQRRMEREQQNSGASETTLDELFEDGEMDPSIEQVVDCKNSGGGAGVNFNIFGVEPCKQLFLAQDGQFKESTSDHDRNWANESDKTSKLLQREKFRSPSRRQPIMAKIFGKEIHRLQYQSEPVIFRGHRYPVINLAYDATRDHIVSCDKQSLRVWKTGSILNGIRDEKLRSMTCSNLDRSGRFLATGHADGSTCVWDVETGKLQVELKREYEFADPKQPSRISPKILSVRFDSTGQQIVTRSAEHSVVRESDGEENGQVLKSDVIRVWNWSRSELRFRLARRSQMLDRERLLGYSAVNFVDQQSLVIIDNDQHAITNLNDEGEYTGTYSGDGLRVIDKNGKPLGPFLAVRRWNLKTGESDFEIYSDATAAQPYLCNSGKFAAIHVDDEQQLIELTSGTKRGALPLNVYIRENLFFVTNDGRHAIVPDYQVDSNSGRIAKLVDTRDQSITEVKIESFNDVVDAKIVCGCWDKGQQNLAIGLDSGHILIFNLTNQTVRKFLAHSESVLKLSYTHDGNKLVSSSDDRFCRAWSSVDYDPLLEFGPHESSVADFQLDPEGDFVLTMPTGQNVQRWPLEPTNLLNRLESPFVPVLPRQLTESEKSRYRVELFSEASVD